MRDVAEQTGRQGPGIVEGGLVCHAREELDVSWRH